MAVAATTTAIVQLVAVGNVLLEMYREGKITEQELQDRWIKMRDDLSELEDRWKKRQAGRKLQSA